MSDHKKLLEKVQKQTRTHTCPSCDGPAYCAMEAGKSASLCWCMHANPKRNATVDTDVCLCKKCL